LRGHTATTRYGLEVEVWARDLSLEGVVSALLTAINRLGDPKRLFLRERETA